MKLLPEKAESLQEIVASFKGRDVWMTYDFYIAYIAFIKKIKQQYNDQRSKNVHSDL